MSKKYPKKYPLRKVVAYQASSGAVVQVTRHGRNQPRRFIVENLSDTAYKMLNRALQILPRPDVDVTGGLVVTWFPRND